MLYPTRFLLTQSLLGAWEYIFKAYDPDSAYQSFLKVLERKPTPRTKAIEDGILFENLVTGYCEGAPLDKNNKWGDAIKTIGDELMGSRFQVPAYRNATIDGLDFLLYGRLDALKAGVIYDIKFSKTYEPGKYYDSPQHPMYFELCPEVSKFVYLISNGREVCREEYKRNQTEPIKYKVEKFLRYLNVTGAAQTYIEKWKAN